MSADETLFDRATGAASEHSTELGDEGGISLMAFEGPAGFHQILAKGAALEYQANVAALVVLREHLDRELHFTGDVEDPAAAAHNVERAYESLGMDSFLAGELADQVAQKLEEWEEYHGDAAASGFGGESDG